MARDHVMLRGRLGGCQLVALLGTADGGRRSRGELGVAGWVGLLRQNRNGEGARGNERNCYFAEHDPVLSAYLGACVEAPQDSTDRSVIDLAKAISLAR